MSGCPTPWTQQGGTEEPETNTNVSQQEEQTDASEGEVVADYDPDVDYKPEGSDPEIEALNGEEENNDAEYAKMELLQVRILHQMTKNHNRT